MSIKKLVTILGAAALLAGCGGGGSGPSPSPGTMNPTSPTGATRLAISVDLSALTAASTRRSPKQITSDVTALQVNVKNGSGSYVETTYSLGSPPCSGSSPNYTCVIGVPIGSDTIYLATAASSTIVGYSEVQVKTVTSGETATASYTLTPVASSFSGSETSPTSPDGGNLPEDGASHPVTLAANVLAPDGQAISSPIDNVNLFGTTTVTTTPTYTVTPPSQTSSATAGSYTAAGYSFTYDGTQVSGDSLAVKEAYTQNTSAGDLVEGLYNGLVTASSSPTQAFTIPLVRLELPQTNNPTNATLNGTNFDGTSSWYYIAPSTSLANAGTTAAVVFNGTTSSDFILTVTETNQPTAPVKDSTGTTCATGVYTFGTVTGSGPYTTNVTIHQPSASGQAASCVLVIQDASFSGLTQAVNIYPTNISIGTSSVHRQR